MAKAIEYPMLLPIHRYYYDVTKACYGANPNDAYGVRYRAQQAARASLMTPSYGIFKVLIASPRKGGDPIKGTVEGGFLVSPIHDFCGGIIVSSAWAGTNVPGIGGRFNNGTWRRPMYGEGERGLPEAAEKIRLINGDQFEKAWEWLPDFHAYCGPDPVTLGEAEEIMEASLGAAMITMSWNQGRRGVFGADRTTIRPRTHKIMKAGTEAGLAYICQPTVYEQGDPMGNGACVWNTYDLCTSRAAYHKGDGYKNPNTGASVSMDSIITTETGSKAPMCHEGGNSARWTVPHKELDKLKSTEVVSSLPQMIFHNG